MKKKDTDVVSVDDQPSILDVTTWLNQKIHELAILILGQHLTSDFPIEAQKFEEEAKLMVEDGTQNLSSRFDGLLADYLNRLGYQPRYEQITKKILEGLNDEHMASSLKKHSLGRKLFAGEYGATHELLRSN